MAEPVALHPLPATIAARRELANGVGMPWLGLGLYKAADGDETEAAVRAALGAGYRSFDTAALYGNERSLGRALAAAGIGRHEFFVTTKVWNDDQGYDSTLRAYERSRTALGLDYVDLYLIHWPVRGRYRETWRALERLYREGAVRAIGVSNFMVHHLNDLLAHCAVPPQVNQIECHPLNTADEIRRYCARRNIAVEAWRPLSRGLLLDHRVIMEIAARHGRTPSQVLLRWNLQHGIITIPKSVTPVRIVENAAIFDFTLGPDDMRRIDGLNENRRLGPDPDSF